MSWFKVDDVFDEHPKVEALFEGHTELALLDGDALQELAALAAVGLWTLSGASASRRLTDGRVTKRVLRGLAPMTHTLLADRLMETGLFDADQDAGGVRVHDYLDRNPSRERVLEQRQARADAGKKGGERSGESRRKARDEATGQAQEEATASADAQANGNHGGKPKRTPARTRTPIETSLVEPDGPTQDPDPEVARLSHLLADLICDRDPKARSRVKPDGKRWLDAIRLLIRDRDGDVAEVERVLRWSQADPFWQTNVLCPDTLRRQFVQLAQKSKATTNGHRPGDPARDARRARRGSALEQLLNSPGDGA